jgi:3-methyladenine DNA glycosylase/8-oxoguanine DNA glycosylase
MARHRRLRRIARFRFSPKPPYSFALTVHKPAGWHWLTPGEAWDAATATVYSGLRLDGGLALGIKARGRGSGARPAVAVEAYATRALNNAERRALRETLCRALDVDADLRGFYRLAARDAALRPLVRRLYGMREGYWAGLWPLLVLAVTLQMAPIKRSMAMLHALLAHYGGRLRFAGRTVRLWPTPARIAAVPLRELKTRCKLGYRAKVLKRIARRLRAGFPSLGDLKRMDPEASMEKLQELYGVGTYSAAMVTPHASFPLDVWSVRIFAPLLGVRIPGGRDPRDYIPRVERAAERRWGRWRGLALVYVLNALDEAA